MYHSASKSRFFYIAGRLPRFVAGAMDARGNGQYLAEQAQIRYGQRIEQVMLSVEWYRDNMPRYKAAFEDSTIEIPKDADILADHRAFVMDKGVARIPDRRERGETGMRHGDAGIAGALAYYASTLDPPRYEYMPAQIRRPLDDQMWSSDREVEDERINAQRSRRFGMGAW